MVRKNGRVGLEIPSVLSSYDIQWRGIAQNAFEIPITGGIQGKKLEDQSERRETHISNKGGSRGLLGCPITVTL